MEIKQFLKYYVGCEVLVDDNERGILMGGDFIPNSVGQIYYYIQTEEMRKNEHVDFSMPYNDHFDGESRIKPILRRLSSITEEEAKYILDNYTFREIPMPLKEKEFAVEIAKRLSEQMSVAHYLISRGFWLFGDRAFKTGLIIEKK